ncbi:hypothetical protein HZH66_006031 [Vespula vulgaris]|uniref:Thioredoxin-related transmembrane protein 1 n=1 Tax=Vespula vulgaris TaxID=7454 RepID=A0A834N968_VESVU|nr:thioredoxin-related transmembrane protein 1 [Vespula vulgaris]KAF7400847.1 hypothetical protein HZH66_006031 [Vespula vulgaris]
MSYAGMGRVFYIACFSLLLGVVSANNQRVAKESLVEQLDEENWERMLHGEWMVEFYAPWCPACRSLEPVWEHLASWKENLNINVGKVDVTTSPGLSGRFMVTALPTIYHVMDGVFRQYKSPRDEDALIEFVSEKTWKKIDPISNWKNPTSVHMSLLSQFFKLSQILRGVHNNLTEDFGLPIWASYLIFAMTTVILGAILGISIICFIDLICPPKCIHQKIKKQQDESGTVVQEKTSADDEIVGNVKDDLIDEEGSELEEITETSNKEKDSKADTNSPNVRKRKPRKAD